MENYLDFIKNKIKNNISIEQIVVTDNSHKHTRHKFFDKNKYHLHLDIKSEFLKLEPRITAHRRITKILEEELKKKIHALEINIR